MGFFQGSVEEKVTRIREYWEQRALAYGADQSATLEEKSLRWLELKTIGKTIRSLKPRTVLDSGCGNGYSTAALAKQFPLIEFVGVDYSETMIQLAQKLSSENCRFVNGDVLAKGSLPQGPFDFIFSQRCLQNLPDVNLQSRAVRNLLERKKDTGKILLLEGSQEGVKQLNNLRARVGLPIQKNLQPWYNLFLSDKTMQSDFKAVILHFCSLYMFLTRMISHRLDRFARILPQVGSFGYVKGYYLG